MGMLVSYFSTARTSLVQESNQELLNGYPLGVLIHIVGKIIYSCVLIWRLC